MNIKSLTTATALAATMAFAAPAFAAGVNDWNTDNEAGISSDEFRTGLEDTGAFENWDANDDKMLSQDELNEGLGENNTAFGTRFGEGYYDSWDANDDENIGEDEFYDGVYSSYDADSNKVIEEPEFGDVGDDIGDGGFWDV
ncbi:hypothetical protein [Hoeflea sp.]|uniref:hypothetical protein n=1 Tax=Hoeflea sp. TaxID=1940281 RepID=UPI003A929D7A